MKTRSILALLSGANLVLLGVVGFLPTRNPDARLIETQLNNSSQSLTNAATENDEMTGQRIIAKPFHWSQLESTNFQTYVANLRAVGCPEQTIRDIVTAELSSLNVLKREPLRGEELRAGRNLENERKKFAQEDANILAAVLDRGGSPEIPKGSDFPEAGGKPQSQSMAPRNVRVALPLVFAKLDVPSTSLNANQSSAIERLRNQFIEEIGGTDQDANDPAYLKRWQTAQSKVDQSVKTMLGVSTFLLYERQAQFSPSENPLP